MTADYKQLAQELYQALKTAKNCSPIIDNIHFTRLIERYEEATTRGTGRTTALYMKAITEALENPGKSVEFIDHYPHTSCSAQNHGSNLANIIIKLGYEIVVTVPSGGGRVFLYNRFGQ
jgi:hypothetical protein